MRMSVFAPRSFFADASALGTRSWPIPRNVVFMILGEKPVFRNRAEWVAWIRRLAPSIFPSFPLFNSIRIRTSGSLQPTLWRRWLLWCRWWPTAKHSQNQGSRSPSPGVARRPVQGQDNQTRTHAECSLFKVQWQRWEGRCRSHV